MTTLLVSHRCVADHGAEIAGAAARAGLALELLVLPENSEARLPDEACARIELAYFSEDLFPDYARQFYSALRKAPGLKWLQVFNAGVDHPIYTEMLARGVRITTASGATAEPIAQTMITGLLMLARNFPRWLEGQKNRAWNPTRLPEFPRDLRGQTVLVLGLGHIGNEFARLARVLGLTVIGVRRSPAHAGDHADELHPLSALNELLPRADWLVITCPLTPETRGMVDAGMLARLPQGARIINIARGEIMDEPALIAALRSGHLAGAYLDVFEKEPLAPDSLLWDLPCVLISPHNAAAASGNEARVNQIFFDNLGCWGRNAALVNEVARA